MAYAFESPPPAYRGRTTNTIQYRADIDGLRAIAVLSVIGYHLQFASLPGGFTGVDIFFVISGYLIGSILLADLTADRFNLRRFYIRRIRRILPAFFLVLISTFLFGLFFLVPFELADLARSMVAAVLSSSNLYFAGHSDYFDITARARPALQTWSLGVEEQFYLVFPSILWLLFRFGRRYIALGLAIMAALSLAISVFGMVHSPM